MNWIAGDAAGRRQPRVTAQIRHRHQEAAATIDADRRRSRVASIFDEPQSAIAPGQALVMYDGDEVVGGGWIDETRTLRRQN